jgi:tetratricopeptide (TPR) repeat protein
MSQSELRQIATRLRRAQRDAQQDQLGALFHLKALAYYRLGDFTEALDASRNAARYEPAEADHLCSVAAILIELKRFRQALEALREAHMRPRKSAWFELSARLNAAEAHHALGEEDAARMAFQDALQHADPASYKDMFGVASQAAIIGAEDDAVEFFARYVALAESTPCGETPAVEIIRAASDETKVRLKDLPLLAAVIERATARWDAPIPEEHQIGAKSHLSPEAWAQLVDLVEHPPAPTEALRRLFDAHRA